MSKDQGGLDGVPYGITLDKDEQSESVQGIKVVQKTLHSMETYQVFEFGKKDG